MFAAPPTLDTDVFARLPDELRIANTHTAWSRARSGPPLRSFLEGPSCDRDGRLYCVDVCHGRLYRIDARARVVLRDIRDLKSVAVESLPAEQLRLGGIATAMTGLLPRALAELARSHPQIEIYLEPGHSISLYRKVCDGDLDAAVIAQPHFALQKTCAWRTFRREPLVVLARKAVSKSDPHTLLATEPFIRYDRTTIGARLAEAYLRRYGIRPTERFELNALGAIAVMVDRGLGVPLCRTGRRHGRRDNHSSRNRCRTRLRADALDSFGRAAGRVCAFEALLDVLTSRKR